MTNKHIYKTILMSFFSRISSLFSRRSVQLSVVGILAFFLLGPVGLRDHSIVYSGGVSTVWANTTAQDATKKDKNATDEMVENMVAFLNIILGVITFLITPLVMLAGWLLSPDWTFGEIFGLRAVFHNIWILISNVVYVIFAFILVTIAFMNIFGGGHDHAYEIKKALPKLVVSILIVPFTWFIVSAVLSIANVLTASVIQLPADMLSQTKDGKSMLDKPLIPKKIIYDHTYDSKSEKNKDAGKQDTTLSDAATVTNGAFTTDNCSSQQGEGNCIKLGEFLQNWNNGEYNLLSVYAYGIFKIQDYKEISQKEKLTSVGQIVKKLIFGALFFIIFGILVIAIVYALFSRALMLWGFAMFSPLFALTYFFEHVKIGEKAKKELEKFTISKFISLALVPVYVAAALSFGLIFITTVMNAEVGKDKSSVLDIKRVDDQTSSMTFKDVTLEMKWFITKGDEDNIQTFNGGLAVAWGFIGTIIINVLALVVLWMVVMAALRTDDITGAAIKPIMDMGDSVGKLMKEAPQFIPVFPGNQSMKSMAQGVQGVRWGIEQAASTKAGEVTKKFWFSGAADRNTALTGLNTAVANGIDYQAMNQEFHKFKNTYTSYDEFLRDGKAHDAVRKFGKKLWVEEETLKANLSDKEAMTKLLNKMDVLLKTKGQHLFDQDNFVPWYLDDQFSKKTTGQAASSSNPQVAAVDVNTQNVTVNSNSTIAQSTATSKTNTNIAGLKQDIKSTLAENWVSETISEATIASIPTDSNIT